MARFSCAWHPKPELASLDTGLRYTDILFGFVIREIFLRMQYWQNLDRHAWLYLGVCLALVLGSWIGYRRSLNRSKYEIKFFNLPFFRFLLDQAMLIVYFQVVGSTVVDLTKPWIDSSANANLVPDPSQLANHTLALLSLIFFLYWFWDILGMWMARSKIREGVNNPRYPDPKNNVDDNNEIINKSKWSEPDMKGFGITTVGLLLIGGLWLNNKLCFPLGPDKTFVILILLLLLYRFAKEVRSTCFQS